MTILIHLVDSLHSASMHNPDVQAPPICILWPDMLANFYEREAENIILEHQQEDLE